MMHTTLKKVEFLKYFKNSTFFKVVCISWKLKYWILLMHRVTMKPIAVYTVLIFLMMDRRSVQDM